VAAVLLIAAGAFAGHSLSAFQAGKGSITDLGRPTNDTVPRQPLGAFYRIGTKLRQGGKPELLFIGTQIDNRSAAERWPLVKALQQFGSFSGIRSMVTIPRMCRFGNPAAGVNCTFGSNSSAPPAAGMTGGYPTFDWSHARFSSRYLTIVWKEIIDQKVKIHHNLSPTELSLFNRYARQTQYPNWDTSVMHMAVDEFGYSYLQPSRIPKWFPLVLFDGYIETGSQIAIMGDLTPALSPFPLPFSVIQQSLQRGKPVGKASASLIHDYNAEANIITALICHADGKKPASVCGRRVIKRILRYVRG
jgi:hypothetical protein